MTFHVVAPLSALSRRTRLYKLARFVGTRYPEWSLHHVGWERLPGEADELHLDQPIEKTILLRGGGYGGRKSRVLYLAWMLRVFQQCLSIPRQDVVWALGFESAWPAILAGRLKGFKVVYDDADRFSLLFPFPSVVRRLIDRLEAYTSRRAHRHVIPCLERYDFRSPRFFVLRNMPSASEVRAGRSLYAKRLWPRDRLVVNVNGWLGAGRGMDASLVLARRFEGKGLSMIVSGKIDCADAQALVRMPNVHYLGEVSNRECLASYFASDLVFTYYRPDTIINRLAASNKWGDAIKTGAGVIVNEEVETARYLREAGAAIAVPYADHEALCREVAELLNDGTKLAARRDAAAILSKHHGYFEDQLSTLFATFSGDTHGEGP